MKTSTYLILICLITFSFILLGTSGAAKVIEVEKEEPAPVVEEAVSDEVKFEDITLPEKDSPEYWVVRSEAIGELTPLLTKKRAEIKKKRQLLADYLLKIGKAEEMAAAEIKIPDDPALYAKALGVDEELEDLDAMPKKRPTWNELAEFSMRYIIHEGYMPMEFDSPEDAAGFAQVCKSKEAYAQKVRKQMLGYVEDLLKMWTYLGTIGEQAAAKEWAVGMKLDAEKMKNAERAMLAEQRRMASMQRREEEKERKFQDAQDRASFSSSEKERRFDSRQDRLQYQQTLLSDRYTNSYRW
jgi:anti-sigma-K factor RskA